MVETLEKRVGRAVLHYGNVGLAAVSLGVTRSTLERVTNGEELERRTARRLNTALNRLDAEIPRLDLERFIPGVPEGLPEGTQNTCRCRQCKQLRDREEGFYPDAKYTARNNPENPGRKPVCKYCIVLRQKVLRAGGTDGALVRAIDQLEATAHLLRELVGVFPDD